MKRILAFLLCATLLFSVPVVGSGAEEANPERDAAVTEVTNAISALGNVTLDSRPALQQTNQKINDFGYNYGYYNNKLITNLSAFDTAITKFNDLIDYQEGDTNKDDKIDAKDALDVLKYAVGKMVFNQKQMLSADVDFDKEYNAKDALMILQYAVGKRSEFPSQVVDHTPYEKVAPLNYTAKGLSLYQETYQSMLSRIREDGYAETSLTGAYKGMFCRDASIQIMAHIAAADFEQARMILQFITRYHAENQHHYLIHIIRQNPSYYKQADTTFFFLHAWFQFATRAPKTEQNIAYIEGSYEMVKTFANYYLDNGYLHEKYNLLFNESFEHSRGGVYWQSYDLLTNVYASQALHELAEYFKTLDPQNAQKWQEASQTIANGIHTNLTATVNGALMYAELRGRTQTNINSDPNSPEEFIAGLSWVNLAPVGCDWYAADPEIMEHTYQTYLKYGSVRYRNSQTKHSYLMLEVAPPPLNTQYPRPTLSGNHIVGKGLAWELMYCHQTNRVSRMEELVAFIEENSNTIYPEAWIYGGKISDEGNQEQASWLLLAHKTAFPKLKH